MDPALNANLSMIRDHLQLFVCLLFGLPIVSFIGIKFWIAIHSAKVQRTTNWFVPTDLESDVAKMHFGFAHRIHRNSHRAVSVSSSSPKRKA